jgi:DNA-binding GntR family transcriptional regulator
MDLDRTGPVVHDDELPPGSRLENEVALIERLRLSRPTVRRPIQELVDKGMLVRRRGIGTQVVHGQVTRRVELTSLFDDLSQESRRPGAIVLMNEVIPVSERIARMLSIEGSTPVLHLRRGR